MAQTTGAMSSKNGKLEYSLNLSDWVDISGTIMSVTPSGGNRKTGEAFTASGDTPLILSGKREATEVTFKIVYTEAAGTPNAFEDLFARHIADTGAAFRWSPTAYDTGGQKRYTTSDTALTAGGSLVKFTSFPYPSLDFSSGDPVVVEFAVRCSAILTEDHA